MSDIAISVRGVSKKYTIGKQKDGSLRGTLGSLFSRNKATSDEFWALKDVSFDIQRGDVVGIIGKNGAGKSTILKILSQITRPTEGEIEINGRIASLLEVGTGFHPELTGRENIYLNGTILGMTRKEVAAKFDEIVAFSGVEKFIDTPVKHYSSGMYVRLAFAVAAHLEPEILIIDEVLAVGDAEFQKKCLGKMKDVAGEGRTVIFVSHDLGAVKQLCNKGILMKQGQIACIGKVEDVIEQYSGSLKNDGRLFYDLQNHQDRHLGNKYAVFKSLRLEKNILKPKDSLQLGIEINVENDLIVDSPVEIGVYITDLLGNNIYHFNSIAKGFKTSFRDLTAVKIQIPCINLKQGVYQINLQLMSRLIHLDYVLNEITFEVVEDVYFEENAIFNAKIYKDFTIENV